MKDVAYWCKQKRHFMRVLRQAIIFKNKKAIEANTKNVNKCDLKVRMARTAMWLLIGAVVFVSGCQTMKGIAGDSGWMLTKLADNITTE